MYENTVLINMNTKYIKKKRKENTSDAEVGAFIANKKVNMPKNIQPRINIERLKIVNKSIRFA